MITSVEDLLVLVDKHSTKNGHPLRVRPASLGKSEAQHILQALRSGYVTATRQADDAGSCLDMSLTPEGMIAMLFVPRTAA